MLDNEWPVAVESLLSEARRRREEGQRFLGLTALRAFGGQGLELLYHFDDALAASHLRLAVPDGEATPSLAGVFPGVGLDEADCRDRFGMVFSGEPHAGPSETGGVKVGCLAPFGQALVRVEVEGARVVRAEPIRELNGRDPESGMESRPLTEALPLARRLCGLCSYGHGLSFCLGLETLLGVAVTPRAEMLRILWAELHRVASHLFWMGRMARFLGFERLFLRCLRLRERVLAVLEATAGDRVIASVVIPGGVGRDIDPERIAWLVQEVAALERGLRGLEKPLLDDYVLNLRTRGVGLLPREQARVLGAVGPVLRASGWEWDMRALGLAGYGRLDFAPCCEPDGDVYSRVRVRLREALVSCDLARQCLETLPPGEIVVPVALGPIDAEAWVRVEQPRGEQFVYLRGHGGQAPGRVRFRTASRANLAPTLAVLPGLDVQEAGLVALSMDLCQACASG